MPDPSFASARNFSKPPSITAGAEQQIQKTSNRQQVITEDKVLKILDIRTCSQWLEAAPDIKSKYTWKRQDDHYYTFHATAFFTEQPVRSVAKEIMF